MTLTNHSWRIATNILPQGEVVGGSNPTYVD